MQNNVYTFDRLIDRLKWVCIFSGSWPLTADGTHTNVLNFTKNLNKLSTTGILLIKNYDGGASDSVYSKMIKILQYNMLKKRFF